MLRPLKTLIRETPFEPVARRIWTALGLSGKDLPPTPADWAGETAMFEDVKRYDEQTRSVMERCIKPGSNCIDVGAHQGDILRQMIDLAPSGHHVAFEPIPELAAGLRQSFPGVEIMEVALGEHKGQVSFQHVLDSPGYSGLRQRDYDRMNPTVKEIQVQMECLDDLWPEGRRVAFIKIDVEGAELWVMRGGRNTLQRNRPVIVFEAGSKSTSFYQVTPEHIVDFLCCDCGLKLSTMARWLEGQPGFTREGFCQHYAAGLDYYFMAYPGD